MAVAHLRSINKLSQHLKYGIGSCGTTVNQVRFKGDGGVPYKNLVEDVHAAVSQPEKGKVYDKKPFKYTCVEGKSYSWCSCGQSKTQPFCDGTHKNPFLKIKLRPVRFVVPETKEYWLCNCKQTANRPFCDGSHRKEDS